MKPQHYQLNLLCIPKKDGKTNLMTEVRVARHGSFCSRRTISLNDLIDSAKCKPEKLPNLRAYVKLLIAHEYVSLRDLKDAFRNLLIALRDRDYIQYQLFGLLFKDNRIPYGIASASANCQDFGLILIWILERNFLDQSQWNKMLLHIDDFIIASNCPQEAKDMA